MKKHYEKKIEKSYGRFVQASCDAQWMTPNNNRSAIFFGIFFFPDVWEAATAVTLVQRKINEQIDENINERLAFFSIFGGVLRTAAKNRK